MTLRSWLRLRTTPKSASRPRFRPALEELESRRVLAGWTVTSPYDLPLTPPQPDPEWEPPHALRWAIGKANDGYHDTIDFNINNQYDGALIVLDPLLGALPHLVSPMTITGRSPGEPEDADIKIYLSGEYLSYADGLVANAGEITVEALGIGAFHQGSGIFLNGDDCVVEYCYLGPVPVHEVIGEGEPPQDRAPNKVGLTINLSSR